MNLRQALFLRYLRSGHHKGKMRVLRLLQRFTPIPFLYKNKEGFLIELDPTEWGQLDFLLNEWSEPFTLQLLKRILKPGDVYVDVGAHIGIFCLLASQIVTSKGKVIAIEPQPENVVKLLRNIELNNFNNVKVWVGAAGSTLHTIDLPVQAASDRSRLSLAGLTPQNNNKQTFYRAPIYPLQDILLCESSSRVNVLQIDVEGYELEVLKGIDWEISKPEHIILEYLDETKQSDSGRQIIEFLHLKGYQIKTVQGLLYQETLPLPESNLWCTLE